ncbi:MAG: CRTAC1 family protein [Planctomycetota bacterium]|nr:CRTAC1 family protein [Planctomycetota bacterium]
MRSFFYLLALFFCLGCGEKQAPIADQSDSQPASKNTIPRDLNAFHDATSEVGLKFTHYNGMTGELYLPELMGSGTVLFDYDNDGDLDVYLIQGALLGESTSLDDSIYPPQTPPQDQLFRNDLTVDESGNTTLTFVNVTKECEINASGYGMGAAVTDFNQDGWLDLYVTNWGKNQLWKNNGDGTFSDVTMAAGVESPQWGTSAAFVDINQDGWDDLYVSNYITFGYDTHRPCYLPSGAIGYCGPKSGASEPDRLFLNQRDGTFQDISAVSGIAQKHDAGLGVLIRDFNNDLWPDIYVANDAGHNHLWINQQDETFVDEALIRGCACNIDGLAEGSMGVDAADIDGDGDEDLVIGHWAEETNTVYLNLGNGYFEDATDQFNLGVPSVGYTAFGTAWFDFDNDGWLDLFMANGATNFIEARQRVNDVYPLQERNQLFRNIAGTLYEDVTDSVGILCETVEVTRGASFGDLDNDGDTDILISNNSGPARIYTNQIGANQHWLGVTLQAPGKSTPALQCRIDLQGSDDRMLIRTPRTDGSYLSVNDPRVLFGLGTQTENVTLRVHWPDGAIESYREISIDQYVTLVKGEGIAE